MRNNPTKREIQESDATLLAIMEHIYTWSDILDDRMESGASPASMGDALDRIEHWNTAYTLTLAHRVQFGIIRDEV